MFLRNVQTGEISQYSGGSFHLVSVPVATTMKLNGSNVVTITADQYNKVPKTTDYLSRGHAHPECSDGRSGSLQRWSAALDLRSRIHQDEHHHGPANNNQRQSVQAVPQGQDYFPESSYLQNQVTGEISQYSGGYNHLISAPVAAVMGLTSAQLISVTPASTTPFPRAWTTTPTGSSCRTTRPGRSTRCLVGSGTGCLPRTWWPSA